MNVKNIGMAEIQLTEAEISAALSVLKSGSLRQGKHCDALEAEFVEKTGAKYAVTCANGSATLHLAYMSFIKPGDEVLVPSFTFIATGSMVHAAGGIPVFCDVDPETYLIDLQDAASKITDKTVAISPVHLFGNVCDIDAVQEFANQNSLKVVWDAAQAHGGQYKGQDIGSFSDFVSYSFYPSKNMFVGEGGIVLTDNEEYANKIRFMRSHGQTGKYLHTMDGLNYRMTDVEAAIGREQFKRLDTMLAVRRNNFKKYNDAFSEIKGVTVQKVTKNTVHAVHQYCILIDPLITGLTRDDVALKLKEYNISSGIHYPRGMHQQPVFIERYGARSLPVTERLCEQVLALPVHHGLDEADSDRVVETFTSILNG